MSYLKPPVRFRFAAVQRGPHATFDCVTTIAGRKLGPHDMPVAFWRQARDLWDQEPTEESEWEWGDDEFIRGVGEEVSLLDFPAVADLYSELRRVLDDAVEQASGGKGVERHANSGERFEDQQIVQLCEWLGSTDGDIFQACKKAIESKRLPYARARGELLGAINYLAAAVIVLDRAEGLSGDGQG